MPRKTSEGTMTLPGMDDSPAPQRPRVRSAPAPRTQISTVRVIAWSLAAGALLVAGLYAFRRIEQFLILDPRFALNGPEGSFPGSETGSETLEISGAMHASRRGIEAVFAEDLGRSIYLIPLSERRTTLRTLDWVKDASLARIWPNRLIVRITERKPVAFLTLASGRVGLIDEDGVILPPAKGRFDVPVLDGVRMTDPVSERRERVQRFLRLMKDLGDAGKNISEVDVSDRDDVKVSQSYQGGLVTLLLGDHDFSVRYQNFLSHVGEIKRRLPGASTLDLRLEDRITVVE